MFFEHRARHGFAITAIVRRVRQENAQEECRSAVLICIVYTPFSNVYCQILCCKIFIT